MSEAETWLAGRKERVAEQKRLLRAGEDDSLSSLMLDIGDTNFLITPKEVMLGMALEMVCDDLASLYKEEGSQEWKWGGKFFDMIKIHQLGVGEPDNFRNQALQAGSLEAEALAEKRKTGLGAVLGV